MIERTTRAAADRTPGPDGKLPAHRQRDAASTRQLLLEAARHRFASFGYAATTVRDVADDAGVNVALISRYFTSKEGLFEACLSRAVDNFGRTVPADMTLDQVPHVIASQLAGPDTDNHPNQLLLLLRSSGDERADRIRLEMLHSFAERLAVIAGWRPDHPDGDRLMLNAQIALSATVGIALLRSSAMLEPLSSADQHDLLRPLEGLIGALLKPE